MNYNKIIKETFLNCDVSTIYEGLIWYRNANKIVKHISRTYNIDINVVAQVISALSPATDWNRNIKDTFNLIRDNSSKVTTYGTNKDKAIRVLKKQTNLVFKGAPKTFSFYQNILLNDSFVTIDRWILRVFNLDSKKAIKEKDYIIIQNSFIKVAKELDIKPYQLQAIVWIFARNNKI
jgi:hypothetical protein